MNRYHISFRDDDIILTVAADGYTFSDGYFSFYVGELNPSVVFMANAETVRYVKKS